MDSMKKSLWVGNVLLAVLCLIDNFSCNSVAIASAKDTPRLIDKDNRYHRAFYIYIEKQ
jgi:hypothetical protein